MMKSMACPINRKGSCVVVFLFDEIKKSNKQQSTYLAKASTCATRLLTMVNE